MLHAGAKVADILTGKLLNEMDTVSAKRWAEDPQYVALVFKNAGGARSELGFFTAARKMLQDVLLKKNGSPVEDICSSCLDDVKEVLVSHLRDTLSDGSMFHEWIT